MAAEETPKYNKVCPICWDEGNTFSLSCHHHIHIECARGLTDVCCPICRSAVTNWPSELKDKISDNQQLRREEIEEEERQEIIGQFQSGTQMTLVFNPPPQVEIAAAQQYLAEKGIPSCYVPTRVNIRSPIGHPRPPVGVLFAAIVGQAIERAAMELEMYNDSDSESSDSDSDDSCDSECDCCFELDEN